MIKRFHTLIYAAAVLTTCLNVALATTSSGLTYVYPSDRLKIGQSLGNNDCYVTLDGTTDLLSNRSSVRFGLRESTNQKYYLLGWKVRISTILGKTFTPVTTTFAPAYQETLLRLGNQSVEKRFFLPFESGYLRSAHFLLNAADKPQVRLVIETVAVFPKDVTVREAKYKGHKYLVAFYPDRAESILWGSQTLRSFKLVRKTAKGEGLEVVATFDWIPSSANRQYALSFAYELADGIGSREALLGALFDIQNPKSPNTQTHLFRIHNLLSNSVTAINRYLDTTQLWTPNPTLNRGYDWAKVNQLRMQEHYKWGEGFSNNPPSDIVVGRDSYWYLSGSSFYAQAWSRKLLDLWFSKGRELNGKFMEYMAASRDPIFRDDYGLNINDDTPLLILAACQYYALTGDLEFLHAAYPMLLESANYILSQRWVGKKNHYGLVWCSSSEKGPRGICGWRNVINDYNLSGAVTEINSECYAALLAVADLARSLNDDRNYARLQAAAGDLRRSINVFLRSKNPGNPFYYLNIDPSGSPVADMTADLLFPVLFGVSDTKISDGILHEMFSDRFWVSGKNGAGGIRTVSSAQRGPWGYRPRPTGGSYGCLGGVWPNVALWVARAAATNGMPDLTLKALLGTFLLSVRDRPIHYNVVAGEFPEYFDGDDLVQRGMPLSPFVPGIYIWSALEGFAGICPRAKDLVVDPKLPVGWTWLAVTNMPYRGSLLTILADGKNHTLYTTFHIASSWKQVVVPGSFQQRFVFVSKRPAFWMAFKGRRGDRVLAGSAEVTRGEVIDRESGRVLLRIKIPAGDLIEAKLP